MLAIGRYEQRLGNFISPNKEKRDTEVCKNIEEKVKLK